MQDSMRFCPPLFLVAILAACSEPAPTELPARPVQTTVVQRGVLGTPETLSGQIQARNQANLAFRLSGRLVERMVSVGDPVTANQLVARLENQDASNALRAAEADLSAAQAALVQARNNEARISMLVEKSLVPRSQFDDAVTQLASAESRVKSALANVQAARDNLGYTELHADMAGTVTETGAEAGEVVSAGQMIVRVANEGGRDAVFNVPAQLLRESPRDVIVTVALSDDPAVTATGRVREVSPQADPATGTHAVRIGLVDPPPAMSLGATVVGGIVRSASELVELRGSALTESGGRPAVWVVDPGRHTVSLRPVDVLRYDASEVIISGGLEDGEIIVTAGVHALRPDQEVRLLEPAQ